MATATAIGVLAAVLVFATIRPRHLPEVVIALPGAVLLIIVGVVSWTQSWQTAQRLAPTVAFLAAVLMLAHAAGRADVFTWAAAIAGNAARGDARRLLALVFVIASVTTAALSLDATVVLLTPVVLTTAAAQGLRTRPPAYACAHLANTSSILLPVANLTNLLAFSASGLSFVGFAARMALPWLATIAVEFVIFRQFFRRDLSATDGDGPGSRGDIGRPPPAAVNPPRFALAVLAATLLSFGALEQVGIAPAWVALAGSVVLLGYNIRRGKDGVAGPVYRQIRAANPAFCLFVFALGVVVAAVSTTGLGHLVARLMPTTTDLPALLATAILATVLANLLNNLPATLLLVPLAAHEPALILAVLLGVNIGPNLTYVGSLATLLWRDVLHRWDRPPDVRDFLRLGALTVPACLMVGVSLVWALGR